MNTLNPVTRESDAKQGFLHADWPRVILISALIILPCFWHRHLEAGDLGSHVFNAWLAHLIQKGQVPGLYIVRQWNNVLFDLSLTSLAKCFGLQAAEKIATSAAVLIFFWGAFALTSSVAKRLVWSLIPIIAMVTYGWTFEEGLMNYYISIGMAFFGLAILRSKVRRKKSLIVILAVLIWLANPLGLIFLICAAAYIFLAESVTPAQQAILLVISAALIVGAHFAIGASFPHDISSGSHYGIVWRVEPGLLLDGHDQLFLYGPKYLLLAYLLEGFIFACILIDVNDRKHLPGFCHPYSLPSQLYALCLIAAALLPADIRLPQYSAAIEFLTERLTSVSAVFAICLLASVKPRKWHSPGAALIAAAFFIFLYHDTATINRMEDQLEKIVRTLPPGQRVIANISWPGPGSRVETQHIVDRACVERCFSYANYEPSTGQFRVRAELGNPYVIADSKSIGPVVAGNYVVQKNDVPLFEIHRCDSSLTMLCVSQLAEGETNGSILSSRPR